MRLAISVAIGLALGFSALAGENDPRPVHDLSVLESCDGPTPEMRISLCRKEKWSPTGQLEARAAARPEFQDECRKALVNCACELLGPTSCDSLRNDSRAAISSLIADQGKPNGARAKKGPKVVFSDDSGSLAIELDSATTKATVSLVKNYKALMKKAAKARTTEEADRYRSEAKELENRIFMDQSERIRNLGSALFFLNYAEATSSGAMMQRLTKFYTAGITGLVLEDQVNECRAIANNEIANLDIKAKLMCMMRAGSSDAKYDLMNKWSGCNCAPRLGKGSHGIQVKEVCIGDWFENSTMSEPIDRRIEDATHRWIDTLNQYFKPYRVKEVSLMGCASLRLEVGAAVTQDLEKSRRLEDHHFSDHARGTSCDLAAVQFIDAKGNEKALNFMGYDEEKKKTTPFLKALEKYRKLTKGMPSDGDLADFFRRFQVKVIQMKDPEHAPEGLTSEEWFHLRAGIFARNAMVDSCLVVFPPSINQIHYDHLHYGIPDAANRCAKLKDPKTAWQEKEKLIRPELKRAMGK